MRTILSHSAAESTRFPPLLTPIGRAAQMWLVDFEVIPVTTSSEAAAIVASRL